MLLYNLLFYLLLPFVACRLAWRGRKDPRYLAGWSERMGFAPRLPFATPPIWVHAVSAGETIAIAPLVRLMRRQWPEREVLVTNTTPTGAEQVGRLLRGEARQCFAPWDLPDMVERFLDRVRPAMLILVDTELWPNTIRACHRRGIPVLLLNGRLSERSARRYGRIGWLARGMLERMSLVACQSAEQGERFLSLGLPAGRLRVTGSIKFDLQRPPDLESRSAELRRRLGAGRLVWVAASTHAGEEDLVLRCLAELRAQCPELLLVLVPRHPERFAPVIEQVRRQGLECCLHSEARDCASSAAVLVVDAMGVLIHYYAVGHLAFVGGSLVDAGGHNMMEAAEFSLPLIMGPHLQNVAEIAEVFRLAGALRIVRDGAALAAEVRRLLDPAARAAAGSAARRIMDANRGALERSLALVREHLDG